MSQQGSPSFVKRPYYGPSELIWITWIEDRKDFQP